jgi:hypothetical protein
VLCHIDLFEKAFEGARLKPVQVDTFQGTKEVAYSQGRRLRPSTKHNLT